MSNWREWIEGQVAGKGQLQMAGKLQTRKQSSQQTDAEIDRDGLAAELAACLLVAPGHFREWMESAEAGGNNRGRDLLPIWTGLSLPVEVKQTRYQTSQAGFLLVRPPRMTPGRFSTEQIDDSLYVLMIGQPFQYRIAGWADRTHLIEAGRLNPVPVGRGQRECWGIHWSKLYPIEGLAAAGKRQLGNTKEPAACRRWSVEAVRPAALTPPPATD